ncbi:hypothetical protein [Variovorax sp. RO1]|uniref:hypothetical protein n=1 Tax=Variovorax sp. RO1 TaxID=2066034 RepID=UPI001180461C|nr:hypothetical protein [Variovorax sp. RO1]
MKVVHEKAADLADKPVFLEHNDCSYCHAGIAQFGSVQEASFGSLQNYSFAGTAPRPYSSRIEENIDHPKWMHVG